MEDKVIRLPYEFYSTEGHEEILNWFKQNGFQTVKIYPDGETAYTDKPKPDPKICIDCKKPLGGVKFSADGGGYRCYSCYDENR